MAIKECARIENVLCIAEYFEYIGLKMVSKKTSKKREDLECMHEPRVAMFNNINMICPQGG